MTQGEQDATQEDENIFFILGEVCAYVIKMKNPQT